MNNNEYLFIQSLDRLAPEGHKYGIDPHVEVQTGRQVFGARGVDISDLSIYEFDVYHDGYKSIIGYIAGDAINTSERGGWLEVNLRGIAEKCSGELLGQDLAYLVNRINNHLVSLGATITGAITNADMGHWEEIREENGTLAEPLINYGMVLNNIHG